jgi:RNA polymerase sigma-70 factor (sigma-E family)
MDHPVTAATRGEGLGWRSTGGHRAQGRHAEGLDAGFVSFVRRRGPHHLRTAVLLTGDWHTAEDLVQTCLAKPYWVWDRLDTGVDPDSYLRRMLVNTQRSWWRARWRQEALVEAVPDRAIGGDGQERHAVADTVRRALAALPARQRAALVLRYFEDLPEAQGGTKPGDSGTSVYQGVYDPARRAVRMVVVTPDTGHVTIHLDGQVYVQIPAEQVGRQPGMPKRARWFLRTIGDPDAGSSALAQFGQRALLSPQQTLELARSAGDVREVGPVSGDGWTGTRFAFTLTDRYSRLTGSVDVDGAGMVRRLEFTSTSTDTAHGVAGILHWVLTFWDFGIRERVTLPPDSQVYRDPAPDPRELAERLKDRRK